VIARGAVPELETLPDGEHWRVGDTQFVHSYTQPSTIGEFALRKQPAIVEKYVELCREFHGANIVELGIALGGSTALIALLAQPQKLVSFELAKDRITALDELAVAKGIQELLRPHYGVDQSDRARLAELVDAEFGDTPLDLVVDDASHMYAETVASFDVLYPRLRPGGLFVIEDWGADQMRAGWLRAVLEDPDAPGHAVLKERFAEAVAERKRGAGCMPLHRMGPELMELAFETDVVEEIVVDRHWISIRRGSAQLDSATFRLAGARSGLWNWGLP